MRIPSGLAGTKYTTATMARLAREGARNSDVIRLSREILVAYDVPERDKLAEAIAIHRWVKQNSRYTSDSVDAEVLSTMSEMVGFYRKYGRIPGDCDDLVILEDSLLRSVGFDTRYVTISRSRTDPMNRMQHIYLEVLVGGEWLPLDPILKRRPAGYAPPQYTAKVTHEYMGGQAMYHHSNGYFQPVYGPYRSMGRYSLGAEGDIFGVQSFLKEKGEFQQAAAAAAGPSTLDKLLSFATKGVEAYQKQGAQRREVRWQKRAQRAPDVIAAAARGEPVDPATLQRAIDALKTGGVRPTWYDQQVTAPPAGSTQPRANGVVTGQQMPWGWLIAAAVGAKVLGVF